jgi:hypothetical protein
MADDTPIQWEPAPGRVSIVSFLILVGVIKKRQRPTFRDTYATALSNRSGGRAKLVDMMNAIRDTPYDQGFHKSIIECEVNLRLCERNSSSDASIRGYGHANAIRFGMGEQDDGGANEMRGALQRKNQGDPPPPQPPAHLMLDENWKISDPRFLDLVDWAAKGQGPLAESVDRRKLTKSKSKGRVATFVVDYVAAIVMAHHYMENKLTTKGKNPENATSSNASHTSEASCSSDAPPTPELTSTIEEASQEVGKKRTRQSD